jgi:hypothetical protein
MTDDRSSRPNLKDVFLNVPFDSKCEPLYLALIAGLSGLGLTPRCVLEVSAGARNRLERLFALLRSCGASIHDLSRVELSLDAPRCPRFNMPFELGLAAALALSKRQHQWFVFESRPYRLQKSLSDVNGFDPYIHNGKPDGILRELTNAFVTVRAQPELADLRALYRHLRKSANALKIQDRTDSLFTPRYFRILVATSQEIAARLGLMR